MLLADELIERAWTHPRGERRTIGPLDFDVFVISEKILHEGNYGAPVTQAIVAAPISRKGNFQVGQQPGLSRSAGTFKAPRKQHW